jgi:hypothetical protein
MSGCTDNTNPALVRFSTVTDIATDGTNHYTANPSCQKIRKTVISTGATSTVLASTLTSTNLTYAAGFLWATGNHYLNRVNPSNGSTTATNGIQGDPKAVAADATYLYVATNRSIQRVNLSTLAVSSFVGSAELYGESLAIAGTYLYATWTGTGVRRISTADGTWLNVAGAGLSAMGYVDGTGSDSWFSAIRGMAWDGTNLWIADSGNHRFRKGAPGDPLPAAQASSAIPPWVLLRWRWGARWEAGSVKTKTVRARGPALPTSPAGSSS